MLDLRPKNIEDLNKGLVELENYKNSDLNLEGWQLKNVLDDTLFVQYADVSDDGTQIKRGCIWVPIDAVTFTWRIGKVIIAGPACKIVKDSDYVMFPNDKGIKAANINGIKNVVFLSEGRIFGVVEPIKK
jgi:hypothetical protein